MARIVTSTKSCTVNPLRMSRPLGAALALMGLRNAMPLLHGSQGCTSFGLVLFVRHFREQIPMQTTAMSEVATVLGGFENVEQAIVNIVGRTQPDVIGICTTGVTEIKGDDLDGFIKDVRRKHPELAHVALVPVSTPDFKGAFEDGFASTVAKIVELLVEAPAPGAARDPARLNVLAGSHLTPGDIDELRDVIEAFGLVPTFLPDISGSLDGHLPDDFTPTTHGGVSVPEVAAMGGAAHTLALGEQMRKAAAALEAKAGVPFTLLRRLTGLAAGDELMATLAKISGRPVPPKYRRQRSQLVDAMLDGHFYFGGKQVAIGAEPDMLLNIGGWLADMGCTIEAAVTTTNSQALSQVPADEVLIGDLEDLESRAEECDLLLTHSHGRQAAERLGVPLFRVGIPMFDRLGAAHQVVVGYRGSRDLIFAIGNLFIAAIKEPHVDDWRNAAIGDRDQVDAAATAH
ncbi:nitrogenase molybdenum-iron cofactor biosynthesis protein NifN [Rhodopseudomonas palustris HaA2]|uniref:Nitrogenase iron-molybdenum cofactor biosynthesis protein NifN n=1 Tax=Rhodopseudomonas palustris (strain HaA2) TaxID=316058 RepID=Q2J1H7_RHOP2|nr:nitrogenase iron-molybdenum cofactor biosynthesis protein NifN [Rhodopseudomonas palustris]ABD05683.1 nitrogenase molybdenum-iron cofactor biosynthesis protein NifN [Rhodopseudomonas palustris HaA2]